jgi:hypothetical protein
MNNPTPDATFIPMTRAEQHRLVDDFPDEAWTLPASC